MRFSDILPKHVYTVRFDPVNTPEFDGQHLAVVIKKNIDGKTAIVAPLTSSPRGQAKINIGKILSLPTNLRDKDSFMVYDQVRTVKHDRFIALKNDSGNKIPCPVEDDLFLKIISICSDELFSLVPNEQVLDFHYRKYVDSTVKELVETSYQIKRLISTTKDKAKLEELMSKIKVLNITDISYEDYLSPTDIQIGILDIINESLDETILEKVVPESTNK